MPSLAQAVNHSIIPLWHGLAKAIITPVKVSELGEFALIRVLQEMVCESGLPSAMTLGIGDDAAAWRNRDSQELATTDTMVDGVHFLHDAQSWADLGWKALAVNISDIAAMGGLPRHALVTLGLTPDTQVDDVKSMYEGMLDCCREYGCTIAGGDIVRSPVTFVTVSVVGSAPGPLLTRTAARPGDVVALTGPLGSSAGGLRMRLDNLSLDYEVAKRLAQAHDRPVPRVQEGQILVREGVRAAMDVSDGLVDDLGKLAAASGVGAVVCASSVNVHDNLKTAFPEDYLSLALNGGEDYELLFTAGEEVMGSTLAALGPSAAAIGRIVAGRPGEVRVLDENGAELEISRRGWDHFS